MESLSTKHNSIKFPRALEEVKMAGVHMHSYNESDCDEDFKFLLQSQGTVVHHLLGHLPPIGSHTLNIFDVAFR